MADLTITAANVRPTDNTTTRRVTAGATVTAGDTLYLKASDGEYYPCDVTTGAEEAKPAGVALTNAGDGEEVLLAIDGNIITGGTMTVSEVYVVSASGAVSPASDLTTGDYASVVYLSVSATEAKLVLAESAVVRP